MTGQFERRFICLADYRVGNTLYRNQAYSQILGYHNFLLKHKEEIGSEYEEFLRLEMQVIIQIRREIIIRL